jgi:hypothetical protein
MHLLLQVVVVAEEQTLVAVVVLEVTYIQHLNLYLQLLTQLQLAQVALDKLELVALEQMVQTHN